MGEGTLTSRSPTSTREWLFQAVPFVTALVLIICFVIARESESPALNFSKEDGLLEWGSVFFLFACALFTLAALTLEKARLTVNQSRFLKVFLVLLLLGIGEELSWGQRIFGWEVPAVVAESEGNILRAGDTSLHNLRLKFSWAHINPSDLIFSLLLPIALFIQGVLTPWRLQKGDPRAQALVNRWGFFVPRLAMGTLLFVCAVGFHKLKPLEGVTDVREYEEFFVPFVFAFEIVDYYFKDSSRRRTAQLTLIGMVILWLVVSLLVFL